MKNVLLLIHDDLGQEARLQAALDLTRGLKGHLHCLDVVPPPLMADSIWGMVTPVLYDERPREEDNVRRITRRLANEDVAWSFGAMNGDFADALLGAARGADLVVLNKQLGQFLGPDMPGIAGSLLIEGGALLVAVDEDARGFDTAAPALVAWDGSKGAMDALQRAVPLLRLASDVTIFQSGKLPAEAMSAIEAASYLSHHDIKPNIEVGPDSGDPGGRILEAVRQCGAGTCVMGGFGHNRMREALFGGVTYDLLRSKGPALVVAH